MGAGACSSPVCFIAPAAAVVLVLAELYVRSGDAPALESLRYGVLPVILAIIAHAIVGLGRTAVRTPLLAALALESLGLRLVGLDASALVLLVRARLDVSWLVVGGVGVGAVHAVAT